MHTRRSARSQALRCALVAYDRLLALTADESDPSLLLGPRPSALLNKGYLLLMLMDRPADALVVYDEIVARFRNMTSQAHARCLVEGGREPPDLPEHARRR
jgi:hypothetical protein